MAIYLPRRWRHQPSGPCEIDWRHPLARGLSVAYFPSQGVFGRGELPDYVGGVNQRVPTQVGDVDDCASGTYFAADSWVADVGRYSGALVMSLTPTAAVTFARTYLFGARNGISGSSRLQARRLSGNWVGLNVSTTENIDPGIPFPTGVRATFGVSLDTSTVRGVFNGELFHASGSALSATPTHLVVNSLVTIDNKSNFANATMLHSFATWSRPLSVAEHRAWHENPWQILRAAPRRIWFDMGAGAIGVEINAKAGAAVAAGHGAAIATAIAAQAGAATASGLTAQVIAATAIDAGIGAALASGLPSGVVDAVLVNAQPGTATAAGRSAGVSSPLTVTADVGTATASGLAATIAAGVGIQASVGTATATGLRADVGAGNAIAMSVGTAAARGLLAGVSIGTDIAAGTGAAQALGLPASVAAGNTVDASAGRAAAAGLSAAISGASIIDAGIGAALAAGAQAIIVDRETVRAAIGAAAASSLQAEIVDAIEIHAGIGLAIAAGLPAQIGGLPAGDVLCRLHVPRQPLQLAVPACAITHEVPPCV